MVSKKIGLYYVGSRGVNFGDSINPYIFNRLLDIPVKRSYPTYADITGIGSLLQILCFRDIIKYKKYGYFLKYNPKPIITVGSGFKFDIEKPGFLTTTYRRVNPYILRGKLSHKTLETINKQKYEVKAYGDLGLLCNYLLEKPLSKKYELGIVPHNTDYTNPINQKLLELSPNSILISLKDNPLDTLIKIAQCETIISSSLHGLIAADSLNIPNIRIKLSEHGYSQNIDFKFEDYYSIFSTSTPAYIDFTIDYDKTYFKKLTPDKICEQYSVNYSEVQYYSENLLKLGKELKTLL